MLFVVFYDAYDKPDKEAEHDYAEKLGCKHHNWKHTKNRYCENGAAHRDRRGDLLNLNRFSAFGFCCVHYFGLLFLSISSSDSLVINIASTSALIGMMQMMEIMSSIHMLLF